MLICAAVIGVFGCASDQQTRTVETTTQTQPVQSSETTTTTTTDDPGHSSLLGATANFVWTVVALPFRIVGDALGEIF